MSFCSPVCDVIKLTSSKTVPKKIHISRIGMGICSCNCPVCEEEVMFSEDDLEKYKTLYCIYCGQPLEEE